ncbi:unnamed protein product [Rotaria sordida]|uniref:PLAT domain-containing protein n=1 Tax=Rotaria sordida TaxID=392033 RepID=A0A819QB08_9BILA|nr:unnamed protein product [Rotaria sordida]CAF4028649.1 unnamed protein product [Rotaria sordida]
MVDLIQFGPSMITIGRNQTVILDPGSFSIDPDAISFHINVSNLNYIYYCRIDHQSNFVLINDSFCFGNRSEWHYGSNETQSSLIIEPGLFQVNQIYQFRTDLIDKFNTSRIFSGYLLVTVEEETDSIIISINCIISEICPLVNEYHLLNPNTQVELTSLWINHRVNQSFDGTIMWNLYQGSMNTTIQWILIPNIRTDVENWFFEINSENFTATKGLFINYPNVKYWRFEVIYSMNSIHSIGAIDFMIDSPPENGTCSINPLNGMTSTVSTIICSNWSDTNDIIGYSFYTWTTDPSTLAILGYSIIPSLQVRLPANGTNSVMNHIVARITDMYECITEIDLSTVSVIFDMATMNNLINNVLTNSMNLANNILLNINPIVLVLASGNQNLVSQILVQQAQALNEMSVSILQATFLSNISVVSISVTPLNGEQQIQSSSAINTSIWLEYNQQWNTLAELLASTRCYQLASNLISIAPTTTYEKIQTAADSILRCTSNTFTAINVVLQGRGIVLDLDRIRANTFPIDYETDLESPWSNLNLFADGNDFSWATVEKNRNLYSQQQTVGPLTNHFEIQCFFNHLSTFAGGLLILPEPINWNYVFANADFMKNKTIYLTIILITVFYIILIIYARRSDQKDVEKLAVTYLNDNNPSYKYFYQIIFFTGARIDAGTNSKVQFNLVGADGEICARTLFDPNRKILQRDFIDSFIVGVPSSLGILHYMHLWHDNSGRKESASWFFKICHSIDQGDGAIERCLPTAGDVQMHNIIYMFTKKAYYSMSDEHLWLSIFIRPPASHFTRVQRCTCCFVLLFTAMLLDILYYDQDQQAKESTSGGFIQLGPLHFTRDQPKSIDDDDEEAAGYIDKDENIYLNGYESRSEDDTFDISPPIQVNQLTETEIINARMNHLREIAMWKLIR